MEEVRFCEDCKWCSVNYLPWYKRIGKSQKKCFHPKLNYYKISRSDAAHCREHRRSGACGGDGKYYEPKEAK